MVSIYVVNSSTCLFGIWSEVHGLGPGTHYLRTVAVSYGVRYFGDTTCEASSVVLCSSPSLWHCAVRGVFCVFTFCSLMRFYSKLIIRS